MKLSAIKGAIVADAATMPLHWIYDPVKLMDAIKSEDKNLCEFNAVASCTFYNSTEFPGHYDVGQPTPYGEQLASLQKIIEEGARDGDAYAAGFNSWCSTYGGRKDHAGKEFEENMGKGLKYPDCGANDDQGHCLYKAVLAFQYGVDLEPLVRFHQNTGLAVDVAAFFLAVLNATGSADTPKAAFESVKKDIPESMKEHLAFFEDNFDLPTRDFLMKFREKFFPEKKWFAGFGCGNPQALFRTLHVSLKASSYEEGVRNNILLGGDSASTAIGIGAFLSRFYDIPDSWIKQTKASAEWSTEMKSEL